MAVGRDGGDERPHCFIPQFQLSLSSEDHLFLCSDIPARVLEIEEDAWLISYNPGIVPWRGYRNITRSQIIYCPVVQHCAKVAGNDIGEMRPLATVRPGNGPHMLGPLPARLTGHSDNGHITKVDDLHLCLWRSAHLVGSVETLLLGGLLRC